METADGRRQAAGGRRSNCRAAAPVAYLAIAINGVEEIEAAEGLEKVKLLRCVDVVKIKDVVDAKALKRQDHLGEEQGLGRYPRQFLRGASTNRSKAGTLDFRHGVLWHHGVFKLLAAHRRQEAGWRTHAARCGWEWRVYIVCCDVPRTGAHSLVDAEADAFAGAASAATALRCLGPGDGHNLERV